MAETIAAIVIQQLANLIDVFRNHSGGGIWEDLEFIKGEFERMTAFLRVADCVQDKDSEVAVWVKQVREIAHDAQDVLDEYDLLLSSHGEHVQRIFSFIKNFRARSRLHTEIQSIKSRIHDITEGHHRYCARYEIRDQDWRSGVGNFLNVDSRGASHLQDESDLVGIQKRKGELISLLFDGDSKSKVIPVVGMGGVGKTTLVKKVYEDKDVNSQFQAHAWITVSATYNILELLKSVIKQFYGEIKKPIPQEVQSMDENELREFIKNFLRERKYITVLDDVWDINLWEAIKYALSNGSSHSRVLLTTRSKDVAFASRTDFIGCIYEMKLLSPQESSVLFCKKVFKEGYCCSPLTDISAKILSKCGGLPLAIVAIAGILASKDRMKLDEWEMIYRGVGVELEGEGMLDRVKRILLISFFNLPHHLKVCLLYLSIFPEDHEISCNQVIRLWIAEGFVEEREGLTMEEVGQSYINKLVNGNLVQAVETTLEGRLRTFAVHDILREIIVLMSRKENITTLAGKKAKKLKNKVRRLAIHGPLEKTKDSRLFKHLRSLVLFSPKDLPPQPFLSRMLCGGSRVLKVLDLRGAPLEAIPDEVFKLYLLEYLSLRRTNVKVIPKSIGKLQKLETLDLKDTFVSDLPIEILNLQRLRYLLVYHYKALLMNFRAKPFRAPYRIGCLVSLEKLCYIEADEKDGVKIVREVGKLIELRRLGIEKLRKEDGRDLCSSLERLTNLRSLSVESIEEDEILDLQHNLHSTPNLLTILALVGRLEKVPQWIPSLQCLSRVYLKGSKLEEGPLKYFEDLPNLVRLSLFDAYEGDELHFKAGKFQQLKELRLQCLNGLRKVRVEESSMPCLEMLILACSKLMEELPCGIQHLRNLQYIDLVDMAEKLVISLRNRQNRSTPAKIFVRNVKNGHLEWRRVLGEREGIESM